MAREIIILSSVMTVNELIEVLKQVPGEFELSMWYDYQGDTPRLEVDEDKQTVGLVCEE